MKIGRVSGLLVIATILAVIPVILEAGSPAGDHDGMPWTTPKLCPEVVPLSASVAAKKHLDKVSPTPWGVRWDKHTGLPKAIWGRSLPMPTKSVREVAIEFLEDNRPLFTGLGSKDDPRELTFVPGRVHRIDSVTSSVAFGILYKGIPVDGGSLSVRVTRDGTVVGAGGALHVVDGIDINPIITLSEIEPAILAVVRPDTCGIVGDPSLVVHTGAPNPVLAYKVLAWVSPGLKYIFFVEARSGQVIDCLPQHTGRPFWEPSSETGGNHSVEPSVELQQPLLKSAPLLRFDEATEDSVRNQPGTDSASTVPQQTLPEPESKSKLRATVSNGKKLIHVADTKDY